MSNFDPPSRRIPLYLRPDGKSDADHVIEAFAYLKTVLVPLFRLRIAELLRAYHAGSAD